ncbi:MAG: hypothetical protein ACXADL_02700 [Candidatus Thorarchaeota archaeon]
MKARQRFKTFVTEQKMLFFFQILILIGLAIQAGIFFALLWYGRPPATDFALVLDFFLVAAVWVLTINVGIVLFWWISRLGEWPIESPEEKEEKNQSTSFSE